MAVRFSDEFRLEAVRQVTERGHSVADVAHRLGVSTHSLYAWIKKQDKPVAVSAAEIEIKRLEAQLQRVTEERDILKKAAAYRRPPAFSSTGH